MERPIIIMSIISVSKNKSIDSHLPTVILEIFSVILIFIGGTFYKN